MKTIILVLTIVLASCNSSPSSPAPAPSPAPVAGSAAPIAAAAPPSSPAPATLECARAKDFASHIRTPLRGDCTCWGPNSVICDSPTRVLWCKVPPGDDKPDCEVAADWTPTAAPPTTPSPIEAPKKK